MNDKKYTITPTGPTKLTLPSIGNVGDKITIEGDENGWIVERPSKSAFIYDKNTYKYLPATWETKDDKKFVLNAESSTDE